MPSSKKTDPFYQAQAILSRRDHSEFEVRTKMKRKKFNQAQIDQVVTQLKKMKLLDDRKFTTLYINDTLRFKPVGPKWLAHKLKQKGIASSIVHDALVQAYSSAREKELAQQAARAWRRTHPQHKDDHLRLSRYLISRGFSFDAIPSDKKSLSDQG